MINFSSKTENTYPSVSNFHNNKKKTQLHTTHLKENKNYIQKCHSHCSAFHLRSMKVFSIYKNADTKICDFFTTRIVIYDLCGSVALQTIIYGPSAALPTIYCILIFISQNQFCLFFCFSFHFRYNGFLFFGRTVFSKYLQAI